MRWVNFAVLCLLSVGHAELVVAAINRLHALRLSCATLQRLRNLHDVLLPGVPLAMILFVGLSGPRLLAGGDWSNVPVGWLVWFGLCAIGLVGMAWSAARWWLPKPPACQSGNHSRVIDMVQTLGHHPTGPGKFRLLTRVPGNEIFQVELAEKTLELPGLPRDWDGLSILHLSDLHFFGAISREFFVDRQDLTAWLPSTLERVTAPLGRYFVLGNHDWFLDPEATRQAMIGTGWTSVAGRTISIEHRRHILEIGGTERPWMGVRPVFGSGERPAPGARPPSSIHHPPSSPCPQLVFRLLLSHTPDEIHWARTNGIDLMLAGHNHGGQVVLPVIGPVYSPSRYGTRYASGTFWREPTLMHVSRGISGRHPLRWNCRPEIVKLVLRGVARPLLLSRPESGTNGRSSHCRAGAATA
jgi:hypothetical protein